MFYLHTDKLSRLMYKMFEPTCQFYHSDGVTRCGKKAVAVYVSADYLQELRPICQKHRQVAGDGDGPVYDLVRAVHPE